MSLRKERPVQPDVLWHGTSLEVLEEIKREGLRCACAPALGATAKYCDIYDALGVVCLTDNAKNARFYALVATSNKNLPMDKMVVVRVDESKLDSRKLVPREAVDEVKAISGREYDYVGIIPPEALTYYRWDDRAKDFVKTII